jgi:hypothetical protein
MCMRSEPVKHCPPVSGAAVGVPAGTAPLAGPVEMQTKLPPEEDRDGLLHFPICGRMTMFIQTENPKFFRKR